MSNKGTRKRVKFFTYLKKFEGVNYLYLHICFEISVVNINIKIWEKKFNCFKVHVQHKYWFENATLLKMDYAQLSSVVFKNLLPLFSLYDQKAH